jgi:hypothetical protein
VFGVGGLGHLAVYDAKIAGAMVVAVDVSVATRLDLAECSSCAPQGAPASCSTSVVDGACVRSGSTAGMMGA